MIRRAKTKPLLSTSRISIDRALWLALLTAFLLLFARSQSLPAKPSAPPDSLLPIIGEYYCGDDTLIFFEENEQLALARQLPGMSALRSLGGNRYLIEGDSAIFIAETSDLHWRNAVYKRLNEHGIPYRIVLARPLNELRREAETTMPPTETGTLRKPDLVDLISLDSTILLDIRYATENNFTGARFYSQARALLQLPAAEALVRAHRWLARFGYGLLVHDAYRPWSVTKMFWEATPLAQRDFVANPARGSKHNRGCAVDVTLYDLQTKSMSEMPSAYDEFSLRAYADFRGGTSVQRWHRLLLRLAMEREGFMPEPVEWWHFDFHDWRQYPILNISFEQIRRASAY